ncbi:MAG: pyridoxamine 5'-phosphate oxidase family protein [Eubacteriales bacterium]|jgi:pyridoxamine 5'-phosphate oxidase|nr:pyridoxamine 5'-phosphate oxidase family protein [Eubacteriales bacterium]
MNRLEMMQKIEAVLEDAKAGILVTADADCQPHARWMTPVLLSAWPETLFAVTAPDFPKIMQLEKNNQVEWMLQTRALDQVINIRGGINVLDNPSLKAQVMETIGRKLTVFWKVNKSNTDFVILETVIKEACWQAPVKGFMEIVNFNQERVQP